MMYHYRSESNRTCIYFLLAVATLIVIGFIFIYSSSSIYALEKWGSPHYFVIKHLVGFMIGLCGLIFFRAVPLEIIKKASPFFFFGTLFLTALTLLSGIGVTIHGSARWLNIPGFAFQPSELLKMAFIIYLAYILAKKQFTLASFFYGYLPFLFILGLACGILLKQPDFGQAVTIALTAFLVLFIAKVKTKYLLATLVPLIPVAILLVVLKPYRFKRILIFLDPWQEPKGAGYQIIQSLIAIGSGQFWGVGLANSKQKFFYLPMQQTDFIFSIIAEETGFVGTVFVVSLYVLLLYFGLRLARQLADAFSSYVVLGFVLLITIQAIINLGVATSLLPTKGIGLPFVSFGSSSLVCNLCMLGLIMNCVANDQRTAY
jgi:cell division protein FtsW